MLAARSDKTDNLVDPRLPIEDWLEQSWETAYRLFNDERLAGAATLVRASERAICTGEGSGMGIARFAAAALQETGYEAIAEHAADLSSGSSPIDPRDVVLGIDTGGDEVPAALVRATSSGLRTIGLTDRDLTLIDADVLVPYPDSRLSSGVMRSPLSACAILSLLAARLQPATQLAFEVPALQGHFERLREARQVARNVAEHVRTHPGRLIFAADGPSRWVVDDVARRINFPHAASSGVQAHSLHLFDTKSPDWSFEPEDILIAISPHARTARVADPDASRGPTCWWSIGGSRRSERFHSRLGIKSPAIASLGALFVLEMLLEELSAS